MATKPFLQAPPGRQYVRSFLFSRRVNAPFATLHFGARILLVLCLSSIQLHSIDTARPDPIGATVLLALALLIFAASGVSKRVATLYMIVTLPAIVGIFIAWTLFNPVPGQITFVHLLVYPGFLSLGLATWQGIWLLIVGGYFAWTRKIGLGILIATIVVLMLPHVTALPEVTFVRVPFFHPLTVWVTERCALVALTKVLGYTGMILCTIALVVSGRDAELIGTLRQIRTPQPIIFFISTVFRALDLTLADFETIRLAQMARAIHARPRSFLRRTQDLASIAVPMVAMMIRRSGEIGDALVARGLNISHASADFYEASRWRWVDWVVLAFSLLCLYLSLQPHFNITTLILHA